MASSVSGAARVARRRRTASMAALRVMVRTHVAASAAPGVEGGGVAPDPEERLLRHVLGPVAIGEDAHRETEHPLLVAAHEGSGRPVVARGDAGQQGFVGGDPHGGSTGDGPTGIATGHERTDRGNPSGAFARRPRESKPPTQEKST